MNDVELLEIYYSDNAKRLHRVVDKLLRKFGGIAQKDYDDFYSIANEVFIDVLKKYDGIRDFESFLYSCISKKIISEIERRNKADKCKANTNTISLDAPYSREGIATVGELMLNDYALEENITEKISFLEDKKIKKYLDGLTALQRRIVSMLMEGMTPLEIRSELGITRTVYTRNLNRLKSYEKTKILRRKNIAMSNKEEETAMTLQTQTLEKSKIEKYSVYALIEMLREGDMNPDHPLQRQYGQWQNAKRDNLICTVLNDYPIPEMILAEQIKPYGAVNWLIDGKQRLSYLDSYKNNGFKIGKNAERTRIQYKSFIKDENGGKVTDEEGYPLYEIAEIDLVGKYYKDLPKELKKVFNNFNINVTQFLNCTDTDIEYHIRRYNSGQAMSPAQNGVTHIGEEYARAVKTITENHPFFKEVGNYRFSEFHKGIIDRVVIESIMAVNFLSDWKKKPQEMCAYIKENVTIGHFDRFRGELDRLAEAVKGEAADMFNSKNSFLWFALFDRFTKTGLGDHKFVEFMEAFRYGLKKKSIEGITYESLEDKSTKDKNIVVLKLNLLETLMNGFLHVSKKADKSMI